MAYYEGQTLKQRLDAGPLPIDEALEIATQVAEGLAKAHAQGVVHRDIKPGNLILTDDGVTIVDFGLAKFADALQLTVEHSTIGTVAYMSPEQVRGRGGRRAQRRVGGGRRALRDAGGARAVPGRATPKRSRYAIRNETPAPLRAARPDVAGGGRAAGVPRAAQGPGGPLRERTRAGAGAAAGARPDDSARLAHRTGARGEPAALVDK